MRRLLRAGWVMAEAIRVLLADDHPLVRAGLRAILAGEPDLVLVGEATNGDAALAQCIMLRPVVLLLDLQMPGVPATAIVSRLRAERSPTRVVILTAHREDAWVRVLLDRGAAGYILKDDALDAVAQAVRTVAAGGTWVSPAVLHALVRPAVEVQTEELTPREHEVLSLVAVGRSNKEIASALGIGVRTIEFHLKNIFPKLGVRSRAEAISLLQQRPDLRS